jgi:ankyrin repeat protein
LYYIAKIKTNAVLRFQQLVPFCFLFVPWSQSAPSSVKKGSYKKVITVSINHYLYSYGFQWFASNIVQFLELELKCQTMTNGWTPLHFAAFKGHLENMKMLLEQAEDKNPADNDGTTPLHAAVHNGHLDIAKLILEQQANNDNKNPGDKYRETPLHLAAQTGQLEIVKLLLEHADGRVWSLAPDFAGCTPFRNAKQRGHVEIVQLMEAELKCRPRPAGKLWL